MAIPDQNNQLIAVPYITPTCLNYRALLIHEVTRPPNSQALIDIICQIQNANNLTFEPYECYKSKFIFVSHVLLNIKKKIKNFIDKFTRSPTNIIEKYTNWYSFS